MSEPEEPLLEILPGEDEAEDLPLYPTDAPFAEQRRAWVLSYLASSEIDGKILVENCALLTAWLESGTAPPKEAPRNIRQVK
jgi:hypothetical protein